MAVAYQALAGVFEPGRSFDEAGTHEILARPFGSDLHPEVRFAGPLAVARTPAGAVPSEAARTFCVLAGRIHNLDEVAVAYGLDPKEATEVLLAAAYQRQGDALLDVLSGSFVVVLWDTQKQRGLVAQDQLGTRTLYYCASSSRLFFASDVFLLTEMLPRRPQASTVAVISMLANAQLPAELTAYEGIKRATAGHLLEFEGGRWKRRRYWQPRYQPPRQGSAAQLGEELWMAARRAVRARMDDRPGLIMSGGLDSAVVAAATAAERVSTEFPRTYSAVFPGQPWIDESRRIGLLTEALDLPSVQIEVHGQGVFALSLEYMRRWDLPLTGPGFLLEYPLVSKAGEDGVTSLLDGQGGNEVFSFAPYLAADRLRRGRIVSSLRLARSFPTGLEPAPWRRTFSIWRRFALKGALPYGLQRAVRSRRGPDRYAPRYLTPESARTFFEVDDPLSWKTNSEGPLWWAFKSYLTTQVWEEMLLPEYLRHRAAMGGLDARPPFMDVGLIELALSVPPELDFSATHDRPLMRQALRGRVPDEVRLWHEKSNLASLYHEAVLADISAVRRIVGADDAETRAFVRPDVIRDILEKPPGPRAAGYLEWSSWVWCLVVVECWLRQQRDPSFAERAHETGLFCRPSNRIHQASS